MSIEKQMREKVEPRLKDIQKTLDEGYTDKEKSARVRLESINSLSNIADATCKIIESRFDDFSVKEHLLLLSKILAMQSKLQGELANMTFDNIRDLKETTYMMIEILSESMIQLTVWLTELFPKLGLKTEKMMKDRLTAFENEIQHIKESKEQITVQIAGDYEEALKELTRYIEDKKRAQKAYGV